MIPWSELMSGVGMAGGLWALVRWRQERHNGNGHSANGGSPGEPASLETQKLINQGLYELNEKYQTTLQTLAVHVGESSDIMKGLTGRMADFLETQTYPIREAQPEPAWVAALETRFAAQTAALARIG